MPIDTTKKAKEFYRMVDTILNHEDVKSERVDGYVLKFIRLVDGNGIAYITYHRIENDEW